MLPNDPAILLSYVNTQLRDCCPSLEDFCAQQDISQEELTRRLEAIGYCYDRAHNRFA